MANDESQTRLNLDIPFYRALNADLGEMTNAELAEHYHRQGETEGRPAHPFSYVELLRGSIGANEAVLEIGPFIKPFMRGEHVRYFDIEDRVALNARATMLGYLDQTAPTIDYVSPTGDLAIVETGAFDVVLSSHCIEHVPDLIRHLNEVTRILRPGGRYIVMIPDKRYCLDHYIPVSTVADAIQAFHDRRVTHGLANFIQGYALITHNVHERHWAGDHGARQVSEDPGVIARAIRFYHEAAGHYWDLHAWRFTPRDFRDILTQLLDAGLTNLRPDCVTGTVRACNTFVAVLKHASG